MILSHPALADEFNNSNTANEKSKLFSLCIASIVTTCRYFVHETYEKAVKLVEKINSFLSKVNIFQGFLESTMQNEWFCIIRECLAFKLGAEEMFHEVKHLPHI